MWKACTSVGTLAFTFTLLLPLTAFPSHPHSEYDQKAAPWIGISLSGGGLRAAAFSHGVMLELRKLCVLKPQEDSTDSDNHNGYKAPPTRFSLQYLEDKDFSDDDRSSPCGQGGRASFLDNTHFLSGVSGGAITAAYYKTHPNRLAEFGQSLKDARLARQLISGKKKTPIWRPPVMLFASLLDTIFQTFKLPILPVPEVEVAPLATMWLYDGLFEGEQLRPVYNDLFLHGHTFGDLEEQTTRTETLAGSLFGKAGNHQSERYRTSQPADQRNRHRQRPGLHLRQGDIRLPWVMSMVVPNARPGNRRGGIEQPSLAIFSPMRLKSHLQNYRGRTHPHKLPAHPGRSSQVTDPGGRGCQRQSWRDRSAQGHL
jgi:hypothetical protein